MTGGSWRTRVHWWMRGNTDSRPIVETAAVTLQRFGQEVAGAKTFDEIGTRLLAMLCEVLDVAGAALYLQTDGAQEFELATVKGMIEAPRLARRADPVALVQVTPNTNDRMSTSAAATRWNMCAPLGLNGSTFGFVAIGPKRSGGSINQTDRWVLAMAAAQAGVALKGARLAQRVEQQDRLIGELRQRLETDSAPLRADGELLAPYAGIVGRSATLRQALALVEKVAPTRAPVLITGETGTGKELVARAVHALSPRRDGPLVSVNCPAIPPGLAESDLFGHERGAFTDAVEARPGKFELADGGTVFLDEVADLPPETQVKLLRVLQEHETQRIGSRKVRKLDLRVVAATNRDLHAAMHAQRFREDLYFRLAAVVVRIPPLRQRVDDIPLLATHFLERLAETYEKPLAGFNAEALEMLQRHHWPGNVRELWHVVERAALLCSGDVIKRDHIGDLTTHDLTASPAVRFGSMIRDEKVRRVRDALTETGGNQAAAARLLGISRSNLGRLMKSLGLKRPAVGDAVECE